MLALALMVEPVAQFFTRFEKWHKLFRHRNRCPGARVAALARRAVLHRESAKASEFHSVAAREGIDNFVKDDVDDAFDVAVIKMRIRGRNFLHKL